MKTMNLRDANQQFSRLVREVEESGEPVTILRNGKPAVKISPAIEKSAGVRTPEQQAALTRLLDPKTHFKTPEGWRFDRQQMWEEQINRHSAARSAPDRKGLKKPRYSRNRG